MGTKLEYNGVEITDMYSLDGISLGENDYQHDCPVQVSITTTPETTKFLTDNRKSFVNNPDVTRYIFEGTVYKDDFGDLITHIKNIDTNVLKNTVPKTLTLNKDNVVLENMICETFDITDKPTKGSVRGLGSKWHCTFAATFFEQNTDY